MVAGLDTRLAFSAVVAVIAGERLFEVGLSARNARRTLARGGVESARSLHLLVVVLHTAWIVAAPLEVWLFGRPWIPLLGAVCGVLLMLCMALRYWAVTTLGDRWNLRVIIVPGERPVGSGPFRYFRHPNYAAVYVELYALPLLHGAWLTAALFGTANLIVIFFKSAAEDRALRRAVSERAA